MTKITFGKAWEKQEAKRTAALNKARWESYGFKVTEGAIWQLPKTPKHATWYNVVDRAEKVKLNQPLN